MILEAGIRTPVPVDIGITDALDNVVHEVTSHGVPLETLMVDTEQPLNVYGQPVTPRIEVITEDGRQALVFVGPNQDLAVLNSGENPELITLNASQTAELHPGEQAVGTFGAIFRDQVAYPAVLAKGPNSSSQAPLVARLFGKVRYGDQETILAMNALMKRLTGVLEAGEVSCQVDI